MKKPTRKSGGGKRSSCRGGSGRGERQKLKTARGRTISSSRWLQRQLTDPYVAAARRDGYRSRAAYKLIEIDDRHNLLAPGAGVIDLGAAPGGWSQVAVKRARAGFVLAVDIIEMDPIAGVDIITMDFLDHEAEAALLARLAGERPALILSDMASPATGHKQSDHLRTMALAEAAYDFAGRALVPGGAFLAKVLQGGTVSELLARLKSDFENVRHVKPEASRSDSSELYVLAQGFRGTGT